MSDDMKKIIDDMNRAAGSLRRNVEVLRPLTPGDALAALAENKGAITRLRVFVMRDDTHNTKLGFENLRASYALIAALLGQRAMQPETKLANRLLEIERTLKSETNSSRRFSIVQHVYDALGTFAAAVT